MSEAKAHALYDGQGVLVNVILWDGEAFLGLPDHHRVEPYDPVKHAEVWAAASSPDAGVAVAEAPKARKRLLGK